MLTLSYLLGDTDGAFTLLGCIITDVVMIVLLVLASYFYFTEEDDDIPFDDEDEY